LTNKLKDNEYIYNLITKLKSENHIISLASNFDDSMLLQLKQLGVKPYSLKEPPGFKLGDGKWLLKTPTGDVASQENVLYKMGDNSFDLLYLSQKPVVDHILRLYPETDTICTIHTSDKTKDEPVKSPQIIKYIAIDDEIKDILIEGYEIDSELVCTDNEYTLDLVS
jgi:hypothetical protein